jgi:hypothetical protein
MPPRNLTYYPRSVTRLIDAIRDALAEHAIRRSISGVYVDFGDGRKEAVWVAIPEPRPASATRFVRRADADEAA